MLPVNKGSDPDVVLEDTRTVKTSWSSVLLRACTPCWSAGVPLVSLCRLLVVLPARLTEVLLGLSGSTVDAAAGSVRLPLTFIATRLLGGTRSLLALELALEILGWAGREILSIK